MIVGKSGSGKSTLGNLLLSRANAGGEEEDVVHFTEGHGAEGQTTSIKHAESQDGRFRVIDTPGIPDPNKESTLEYFDAIVKQIRVFDGISLIIFLGHQLRVNPTEFRAYRTLLKQFNLVSCAKVMACRQEQYNRTPTAQMKADKRNGGQTWVEAVFSNSGLRMPAVLLLSGYGNEARKGVDDLFAIAKNATSATPMPAQTIRTYPELVHQVKQLSDKNTRLQALEDELARLKVSLKAKREWAKHLISASSFCRGAVGAATACAQVEVAVVLGAAGSVAQVVAGMLEVDASNPEVRAKMKADEKEIRAGRVDPEKLEQAREDLCELEALATD